MMIKIMAEYWICSKDEAPLQCFKSQFEAEDAFKVIIKEQPDSDFSLHELAFDDNVCIGSAMIAEYKNGKEWWEREEMEKALEEYKCIDRGWDDIPEY